MLPNARLGAVQGGVALHTHVKDVHAAVVAANGQKAAVLWVPIQRHGSCSHPTVCQPPACLVFPPCIVTQLLTCCAAACAGCSADATSDLLPVTRVCGCMHEHADKRSTSAPEGVLMTNSGLPGFFREKQATRPVPCFWKSKLPNAAAKRSTYSEFQAIAVTCAQCLS